jgi:hypothetical protein
LTDDIEEQGRCAEQDCKKALAAEVETFMALLTEASPQLRVGAALTLLSCAEQFPVIEPRLRRRIDEDKHPVVKAALIHVWAKLDNGANSKRVKKKLAKLTLAPNENRLVRLVACLGLVPRVPFGPDSKFARYLANHLRTGGYTLDRLHQCAGGGFELSQCLANRHELKRQLFFALAEKPTDYWKEHVLYQLENLWRERRSSFPAVVEVLGRMLSDPDPAFRADVAWRLSGMGTWTRFAREPLVYALKDTNPDVALRAAVCLSKTRDPAALAYLHAELAPERHAAFPGWEVAEFPFLPPLPQFQTAADKHLLRLRFMFGALRPYGAAAAIALPHLRGFLATAGLRIQEMVVSVVACIGKPAEDMVPAAAELLRSGGRLRQPLHLRSCAFWMISLMPNVGPKCRHSKPSARSGRGQSEHFQLSIAI